MGESKKVGGKVKEIVGGAQKGLGRAIDNDEMEAKGALKQSKGKLEQEAARVDDKARAAAARIRGKADELVGDRNDDEDLITEGKGLRKSGDRDRHADR